MNPLLVLVGVLSTVAPAPVPTTPAVASPVSVQASGPSSEPVSADDPSLVDLNTADIAGLCGLPGIGPKKAAAIVALRERRPLTRVTQLLQVKGIGPKILERLRGRVTLRPGTSAGTAPAPRAAAVALVGPPSGRGGGGPGPGIR